MQEKSDKFIKAVYKKWQKHRPADGVHPDEEMLACFLEGKLSEQDSEILKGHLLKCSVCAENIAVGINLDPLESKELSLGLLEKAKSLVSSQGRVSFLEIFLKLKEKTLEILSTTGDVLVGQELILAPVLRSRKIKDFKDEVNILKDFDDIRVEVKIENKSGREFSLTVAAKEKTSQKLIKDLRVTLIKDDIELESYHADTGKVTFEHVLLGAYKVEVSSVEERLAAIILDIKA